jgi:cytochrome c
MAVGLGRHMLNNVTGLCIIASEGNPNTLGLVERKGSFYIDELGGAWQSLSSTICSWGAIGVINGGAGVSGFPIDVPPVIAHDLDDDFDGSTLDPKWSTAVTANAMTATTGSGWLAIEPTASGGGTLTGRMWGIRQAAPTGSFSVMAKIANNKSVSGTNSYDGIFVGNNGDKGHIWGMGRNILAGLAMMSTDTYGEGASDWAAFNGTNNTQDLARSVHFTWYRIRWDAGASTLYFDYSQNGVFWTQEYSLTSQPQPDSVGIGMYAQANTFHADKAMGADWFRVTEP